MESQNSVPLYTSLPIKLPRKENQPAPAAKHTSGNTGRSSPVAKAAPFPPERFSKSQKQTCSPTLQSQIADVSDLVDLIAKLTRQLQTATIGLSESLDREQDLARKLAAATEQSTKWRLNANFLQQAIITRNLSQSKEQFPYPQFPYPL
ncbi:hypothetical protein TWF569_000240 [Orbilia oligospora]|nr:hypothetical protein TWF751_002927 [Orbilia oligospora]KAF3157675.1 hypothetical protein TWF569_000240 [Orbilia oligospora]KAF3170959.1 hypothetical protein TWF225_010698 [Orbilia oligospora]KAF3240626.1 hypothetical protein TWF128_011241 [Orbilia oligospora]KAF3243674.1 hypothetical protein TWF217_011183 [Orbilia oligospora]